MITVAVGFAVIVAGLVLAFRAFTGHRLMATYDPARGWHEGHDGPAKEMWGSLEPPVEPLNTWSNLAYYVAGWAVALATGIHSPHAVLFALAMSYLAVGSALFHGTLTRWGRQLDHGGMYATFAALSAYALAPGSDWGAALMLFAGFAGAIFGWRKFEGDLNTMMGIGLLVPFALGLSRRPALAWTGLALFAVAAVLSLYLDRRHAAVLGRWKHALWHLLTAAAIALMFLAQGAL